MFPRVSSTTRAYLASTTTGEAWTVSPQSRAIAAICFCPKATRDIPAVGYSSASGMSMFSLRNTKRREQGFDIRQLITSGLARCRSKTRTETYSRIGSDPKENEPVGEWLDMRGRRWIKSPDGGWTQIGNPQISQIT